MNTSEFDYDLPEKFIAQKPIKDRTESKLLYVNKNNKNIKHYIFHDIINLLTQNDVLVFNNAEVIPVRLFGYKKDTKGKVEVFLIEEIAKNLWKAFLKMSGKIRIGQEIIIDKFSVTVQKKLENNVFTVKFENVFDIKTELCNIGNVPLPPYIKNSNIPLQRYQTIYAKIKGAVAAPTAGLHFTEQLLNKIKDKGVNTEFITLLVGPGTFQPVKTDKIEDYNLLPEKYIIEPEVFERIKKYKIEKKRIIAVGTTVVRVLEYLFSQQNPDCKGYTNIFIYPGYKFKVVDSLITNFHLPKSSLLMLVSAFGGKDLIFKCYEEAKKNKYRFYSFGDAMFVV